MINSCLPERMPERGLGYKFRFKGRGLAAFNNGPSRGCNFPNYSNRTTASSPPLRTERHALPRQRTASLKAFRCDFRIPSSAIYHSEARNFAVHLVTFRRILLCFAFSCKSRRTRIPERSTFYILRNIVPNLTTERQFR